MLNCVFHDVNEAYCTMQRVKDGIVIEEDSRNGKVYSFPHPILLAHCSPRRRVLFDPKRDANPFFHYLEGIWMLAGSENVKFLADIIPRMREYSDDGVTLHGAYGYRWRHAFERDQIEAVIYILRDNPDTRRAVISMWDPHLDLERDGKDVPCNTGIYFRVVQGALDMTILNRSNDMVWGMLGANIVHMSMLHEFIANEVDIELGTMYQFSNNVHVYEGWGGTDKYLDHPDDWYKLNPTYQSWPLNSSNLDIEEAQEFVEEPLALDWKCRVIRDNAAPMRRAYNAYQNGNIPLALHHAGHIYDDDWRAACRRWLERREK